MIFSVSVRLLSEVPVLFGCVDSIWFNPMGHRNCSCDSFYVAYCGIAGEYFLI